MLKLKENDLIEKRNILNEIRANNMTLQEVRFFAIYLSKINSRDIKTRLVRFPMDDFKSIMDLGRIDIGYMKNVTNSLLCKVVNVPDDRGGYTGFQLFKECSVSKDDSGEWYVEIDAHDKALPLMFDFKRKYFSYRLWNALRLKSANQLRMYELLKQYESTKEKTRIWTIEELKKDLWLGKNEYSRFGDFKKWVLDVCQQALKEHTDIKFTYEPHGKKGPGGKIFALKFYIEKNEDYMDQLTLDMYIDEQQATADIEVDDSSPAGRYEKLIDLLSEACDNEFTREQVITLWDTMQERLDPQDLQDDMSRFDYLRRKYNVLNMRRKKTNIPHPVGYLKKIIGED